LQASSCGLKTQLIPLVPIAMLAFLPIVGGLAVDMPRLVAFNDNTAEKLLVFLIDDICTRIASATSFDIPLKNFGILIIAHSILGVNH